MFSWRRGATARALLACSLIVTASGCGGATTPSHRVADATPPITLLRTHFAVFTRPRQFGDRLPTGLVPQSAIAGLGLEIGESRLARRYGALAIYLVPGTGLTCIVSRHQAVGGCWPTAVVAKGFATTTSICGPGLDKHHVLSIGVVRDGVSAVTIIRAGGHNRTVSVSGNVFIGKTGSKPPLPLHIAWTMRGKRVVHSTGLPKRVAERGCAAFHEPPRLSPRLLR